MKKLTSLLLVVLALSVSQFSLAMSVPISFTTGTNNNSANQQTTNNSNQQQSTNNQSEDDEEPGEQQGVPTDPDSTVNTDPNDQQSDPGQSQPPSQTPVVSVAEPSALFLSLLAFLGLAMSRSRR